MQCLSCLSTDMHVVRSTLTLAGHRRRRWECNSCNSRWTTREENEAPARKSRQPMPRVRGIRSLTNAEAAAIMLSVASLRELATQYGMSHQAISDIRNGRVYRDVYGVLGLNRKTCCSCRYWSNGCTFLFPEAGGSFSQHCSMYEPNEL
jgi:transposase-like protein